MKVEVKPQSVYIPPQATEEEVYQYEEPEITPDQAKLIELHKMLKEHYKDEAPMISQIEAWKQRWGHINVSKVGSDRPEYYVWRTLQRYEYKEMSKGTSIDMNEAFNEMLVEKCILFPNYEFNFRTKSDAGVITTLGNQIAYKSGFVSPQEALSLIYVA